MHITFPAFSSSFFVKVPSPGPISITKSSLEILALSTILDITSSCQTLLIYKDENE